MIFRLVILITLFCFPCLAAATGQKPDNMTYRGEIYPVHGFQLTKQMQNNLEKYHTTSKCAVIFSSANWNGFYAELSLRDNQLYLINLSTDWDKRISKNCSPPTVHEVFGVSLPADGLFAGWFNGKLVNPYGECTDLTCSQYRLFYFKRGILMKIEKLNRDEFFKKMSQENKTNK